MSTTTRQDHPARFLTESTHVTPAPTVHVDTLVRWSGLSRRQVQNLMAAAVIEGNARLVVRGRSWRAARNDADKRRDAIRVAVRDQLVDSGTDALTLATTMADAMVSNIDVAFVADSDMTPAEAAAWLLAGR